ncbi:MAG: hypothetical protein PHF84_09495 [bacterium]|nr:hypothetical protein [bacterium]
MADEKLKPGAEKPAGVMDKDVQALLDILREKDNLIVSLKEGSTSRDKLNEKQIRLLSEDNSRKLMQIKDIQTSMREVESRMYMKDAELAILKTTDDKLSQKINDFRVNFERYRSQVRSALDQIKITIQEELARREDYKNKIIDELKDNYLKLETQIQAVDDYYKGVIAEIAKKQGMSKKYIRHALNDLQESLSLLDITHAEYIEPSEIKEGFGRAVEDSNVLFQEFKDMKGLPQGATIIKNIENVNIKLSEAPEIEGLFREIGQITTAKQESLKAKAIPPEIKPEEAGGGEKKKPELEKEGGAKPGEGSGDRAEKEPGKKKSQDDIEEIIFKKGRNYAPFNWQEILSDIHLKRFQSFIESCIKAEKEGNFTKALGLYKTIREQPGIANSIASKMLDDHIEYLEDLLKRKYSINYKPVPTLVEKAVKEQGEQADKKSDVIKK